MAILNIAELKWRRLVQDFMKVVSDFFGSRLVSFLASYNPDVTVNDFNVVIVLDKVSDEDWSAVRRMARDLEAKLGVDVMIVPAVVEKDHLLVEEAKNVFLYKEDLSKWRRLVQDFMKVVSDFFGSRLVSFLPSYNPDVTVNDFNVVIVLDKVSDEDWSAVRRMARDLEAKLGVDVMIVPAVVEKDHLLVEEAKNVFRED
ncbi:MAG: hypothetical protein ACP6IP_05885 [Candidatus Njordarchaeia archaeon]